MPAVYETHYVTDPELLAQLNELDEIFRRRYKEHIQQAVEEANADYRYYLPPHMCDLDSDENLPYHIYNPLSSPLSTPPHSPLFATRSLSGSCGHLRMVVHPYRSLPDRHPGKYKFSTSK